jgi:hypothetical protein
VSAPLVLPVASLGPLANVVGVLGFLAMVAWIGWRFGPTLTRLTGCCSWCVAWACGSEGGYGYCAGFFALGTLAWASGTIWYARRRGRWPSAISERLFTRALGTRGPLAPRELSTDSVVPLRRS